MSRQAVRSGSGAATKGPSLAQDILMLGDIYLTLAWMAFQRLRYGPGWTQDARHAAYRAPMVTMLRPLEPGEEEADAASRRHG